MPNERLCAGIGAPRADAQAWKDRLADVSHDLKTPINGILGILGLLEATDLDAPQREMVSLMLESAQALARLVAGLNGAARSDGHAESDAATRLDVRRMLGAVAGLLRPAADAKDLVLHVEVADAVPGTVVGDADALARVVTNLAGNAIKFTEAGEVRIDATIVSAAAGPRLRLTVTDTGPGIPPGNRVEMFARHARGSVAADGSGLGLHICKGLVEGMEGSIEIDEAPGGGCAVRVEVPAVTRPAPGGAP